MRQGVPWGKTSHDRVGLVKEWLPADVMGLPLPVAWGIRRAWSSVQQRLRGFQGQLRKTLPLVEGLLEAGEVKRRFETLEQEIVRLKQALAEVGGEPPGEARRAGAVERLQAGRNAGNVRTR